MQRALRGDPAGRARCRGVLRAVAAGARFVAHRTAAGLARRAVGGGADVRAHAGRIRRGADGGRQHPRRNQDHRHRDLRPRAGVRHGWRRRSMSAVLLAFRWWRSALDLSPPRGRAIDAMAEARRATRGRLEQDAPIPLDATLACAPGEAAGAGRAVGQRQVDACCARLPGCYRAARGRIALQRRLSGSMPGAASTCRRTQRSVGLRVPELRAVPAPDRAATTSRPRCRTCRAPRARGAAPATCSRGCSWPASKSACRQRSPAASSSASRWRARWRANRRCCCSTSRSPRWTG